MQPTRIVLRALGAVALTALLGSSFYPGSPLRAAAQEFSALDPGNRDATCKACDDFYQFADGGWVKNNPIPAAFPAWGGFAILDERNKADLRTILEGDALKSAPPGSDAAKVGAFFRSCMDESGIEAAGLTPIAPQLQAIAAITDVPSLLTTSAQLAAMGISPIVRINSGSDNKDSSKQIAEISGGAIGMPDRDYYLLDDERTKKIRATYLTYLTTLLTANGSDAASAASGAQAVVDLETSFAKVRPSRVELRDPNRTYHPQTLAVAQSNLKAIDLAAYARGIGAPAFTDVNVTLPEVLATTDAALSTTPIATWKTYLTVKLLAAYAPALPKRFVDAQFAYQQAFTGATEQQPRYKRCIEATDGAMGEALGAVYAAREFPPASKARAQELVGNLQAVLHDDIGSLDWMSPATKSRAAAKLAAFTKKIGYPDKPEGYADVMVGPSYALNSASATRHFVTKNLSHIGKPTDRTTWGMSAPTVNAYYNPSDNEIVFPAGILRAPFFSNSYDDALNYGGIGAVIGHEMTHGFDDQGRQFDEKGNQSDWWVASDADKFKTKAQCIVDQFNSYSPVPDAKVQGALVQGEAIADLGGLTIAWDAFKRTAEYKSHRVVDGYTPEQRFFLSYAFIWAGSQREAYSRQLVKTDPHPPDKFRVIGTLSNFAPFAQAFACKAGDKMVRPNPCKIW